MTVDLTDLTACLDPDPIRLRIGEREFAVADMTVAQVLLLQKKGSESNKDLAEYLMKLFAGNVPRSVEQLLASYDKGDDETLGVRQRLTREVMLIYTTLLTAIAEVGSAKKLEAAIEAMRARVSPSTSSTSPAD